MRIMDRLSRLLGRHPNSFKSEADRPEHWSKHASASDLDSHVADCNEPCNDEESKAVDWNSLRPSSPNEDTAHNSPLKVKGSIPSANSLDDSTLPRSGAEKCRSLVMNKPRSVDYPRDVSTTNEAAVNMSESLSWRETGHDNLEVVAGVTSLTIDTQIVPDSAAKNALMEEFGKAAEEPEQDERQVKARSKTTAAVLKIECPGCMAYYEVGRELTPPGGRDMQCSSCGHEWFHLLDRSAGIDPSQFSSSSPKLARENGSASPDCDKREVDNDIAPIEHANCPPLTPSEVRLVISGHHEALNGFIASGRLHAVDPKGDNPLHIAARMGKLALCDLMVWSGADSLAQNHGRQTPADVALEEGHMLVAKLLYSHSGRSDGPKITNEQNKSSNPDPAARTGNPTNATRSSAIESSKPGQSGENNSEANAVTSWTAERVELLRKLWLEGHSGNQISKKLGDVSHNAVLSKLFRLGLLNKPLEALGQKEDVTISLRPEPVPPSGIADIKRIDTESLLDGRRKQFRQNKQGASTPEALTYAGANMLQPRSRPIYSLSRNEMDDLDDLLSFDAEAEPEEFFAQHTGELTSGTFVPLVSSAPEVLDEVDRDWDLDLSPAQIVGDGIVANAVVAADHGTENDFLKVRNRGRQSVKRAVVQTGTRLSINPEICISWAEETLAKGWCSFDDVDHLVAHCEGNGDIEELRINLRRNLEAAGFDLVDQANRHDVGLWDARSHISSVDLAEAIEASLTRTTRLPGTQRFVMERSDELQLLEPVVRAKQELQLGILASEGAVETILDVLTSIRDGFQDSGSVSLRTIIPSRPGHAETAEVMAAAEALKSWQTNGRVMDGKLRREALEALEALDLSLAFHKELICKLQRDPARVEHSIRLDALIAVFEAATERLVREHLPYARRFSARNVEKCEDPEDVFQVAFIGLQRATRRFDPERGYRFLIYATYWMRQAIVRWRADEGTSIRIPVHRSEKIAKLDRASDRLDVRIDCGVSDNELAAELEWNIDEVRQFRAIPREAEYPESPDEWDNLLPEQEDTSVFDQAETERIVTDALAELPERQADVIRMRFGIGRDTDMTLEEIGQLYGVTRERIRQIEAKGLDRLSHPGRKRRLHDLLGM